MKCSRHCGLVVGIVLCPVLLSAANWTRFRGPNGSAISSARDLPADWSSADKILWKTALPGPGTSSPVTFGNRVFLTCYTGYGLVRSDPGNPDGLVRHVLCLDRRNGKLLWDKTVRLKRREDPYRGHLADHGYASSTPVTDGKNVYVFFGKNGVLAFDNTGRQLWRTDVGSGSAIAGWGSGSSPILYKNLVIVNANAESEALIALDKQTGKEVWRAPSSGVRGSWSTPILVDLPGGRQDLVVSVPDEIWGLNPDTGKLRWYAEALPGGALCTSLVADRGVVYAVAGRRNASAAVRAGGKGDVTKSHVVWTGSLGSYVTSPVVTEGYLYWVSDRGIACCVKADSGKVVYRKRLPGRRFYASVVLADGKLFAVSRTSGTFVLKVGPKFKLLAHNRFTDDDSVFNAGPAISDGQILIRSDRYLYSIGNHRP